MIKLDENEEAEERAYTSIKAWTFLCFFPKTLFSFKSFVGD